MVFKITSIESRIKIGTIELSESDVLDDSIIINKIHQAGFSTGRNENELVVTYSDDWENQDGELISVILISGNDDIPLLELIEIL